MKLGARKNLFVSLAIIMMLLISNVSEAQTVSQQSSGSAQGGAKAPSGYIPSGTWSSSRDEVSSASTRVAPGPVGQWSPDWHPPGYAAPAASQQPPRQANSPSPVSGSSQGYSGHGIPSGTWSSSRDEISSASTRSAPGQPGEWSPNAKPQPYAQASAGTNTRNLQGVRPSNSTARPTGTQAPRGTTEPVRTTTAQPVRTAAPQPVRTTTAQPIRTAAPQPVRTATPVKTAPTTVRPAPAVRPVSVSNTTSTRPFGTAPVTTRGGVRPVTNTYVVGSHEVSFPPSGHLDYVRDDGVECELDLVDVRGSLGTTTTEVIQGPSYVVSQPEPTIVRPPPVVHQPIERVSVTPHMRTHPSYVVEHLEEDCPLTIEPVYIEVPVYIDRPVPIEYYGNRTKPVEEKPTVKPVVIPQTNTTQVVIEKKPEVIVAEPIILEPVIERPVVIVERPVEEKPVVKPIVIEEPVFRQPIHIEPPVIEERVVYDRGVPVILEYEKPPVIEFEAPLISMEFRPNTPGIIFGVDEEVDIERCFYEEIEYMLDPEVEDVYEEVVVNTPYGPRMIRSPVMERLARPPLEHDEIVERCMHKTLIAPTSEIGVRLPQVRYVTISQISTGTFEWPVVRKASVFPSKTIEKTVSIPQLGWVDLCQDVPTNEYAVSIPQVHTVLVEQIVHTNECDVSIPQVHTIWISVMGDVNIVQHRTKSRRVHLKQEWDCTIKCEDTRVHFLKLPTKDIGIKGTVIRNPNQDEANNCHSCHTSKCAGVGPAFLPLLVDDTPIMSAAGATRVETKYIEVIKEVPIPCPAVAPVAAVAPIVAPVAVAAEPTEIHHIRLGMCPCAAVAVSQPVQFLEGAADGRTYAGAFPWWLLPLILLGLLLLSMLLAWLLCMGRKKKEVVAAPVKMESPKKKYIIEKTSKEEDEEELEREIARQLQQRVNQKASPPREEAKQAPVTEQRPPVQQQNPIIPATTAGGASATATAAGAGAASTQARPESPGASQRSADRQRSSRGSGSSKKVVKKRIVKMMKQGKLVAEKEEILDEEGNVIRTEIRKEGLSSGSPARSQH